MQRLRELEGSFQNDFSTAIDQVVTDPRQRQRFNQLALQYQGYGAFQDPTIQQRLNLTPQQRQQLDELNNAWNQQMSAATSEFRFGDQAVSNRTQQARQQYDQRVNAILNEQQRQTWQEMNGEPFSFTDSLFNTGNAQFGTQIGVGAQTGVNGTGVNGTGVNGTGVNGTGVNGTQTGIRNGARTGNPTGLPGTQRGTQLGTQNGIPAGTQPGVPVGSQPGTAPVGSQPGTAAPQGGQPGTGTGSGATPNNPN
jgi:2'-5' RNA ligase